MPVAKKSFVPTDDQRRLVEFMAATKVPKVDMRRMITDPETGDEIDFRTMMETFERELTVGATKGHLRVAQNLYRLATAQDNSPITLKAAVHWLRMFAGMKEAMDITYTDASGVPIIEGAADTLRSKIYKLTGTDNQNVVSFKNG